MPIVAYVGKPRSGKSYGVVENVIIPALKAGRTVKTNIPLRVGYLSDDFPLGKIIQFSPKEPLEKEGFFDPGLDPGILWVIDEAWRYWASGVKASAISETEKSFFTEHGHYVGEDGRTTEIVLVTQSLDQIAAFIRNLIEETFRATKLSALGANKSYRVDVFLGAQKGLEGGKPSRQLTGKYKKEIYKYYISHTQNKTDFAAGMEEKVDKRGNIFRSKFFWIVIPVAILVMIMSVRSVIGYFGRYSEVDNKPIIESAEKQEQQQNEPVKVKSTEEKQIEQKARLREVRRLVAAEKMKQGDVSLEYLPISETYRIVGAINDKLMVWSQKGTRILTKKLCGAFSNTTEDYCVLNGELVTWYSSEIPDDETDRTYFGETLEKVF